MLAPRQILVLADRTYRGADAVFRTPYYQQFNRDHARLRVPDEWAFAQLKSWHLVRRARYSTRRVGTIVQAIYTLLNCSYSG